MIIHLNKNLTPAEAQNIAHQTQSIFIEKEEYYVLITFSSVKELPEIVKGKEIQYFVMPDDIQLASKHYLPDVRTIQIPNAVFGGASKNTIVITGPCSIESEEQIEQSAQLLTELGITTLRAGCFKPRTSPYSFQGLGLEGLKLLAKMREKYGLNIITEVRDASHVNLVIEYADIVQIGAKAMYDHGILRTCGKTTRPVLLKRGFGTTLQEFVQAAEFILSGGNENVILCERGIRTFETKTRFTLDLCGVAYLKKHINLPIILDPSHAIGYAYGVADLTRACLAMGIDGLLIETHPNPQIAKSDASQQLNHQQFKDLFFSLKPIADAIGKNLI